MLVYGKNAVKEANAKKILKTVYIRKGVKLYDLTFNARVEILDVKNFNTKFPPEARGVAGEVNWDDYSFFEKTFNVNLDEIQAIDEKTKQKLLKDLGNVVICDRLNDPYIFGAVIRSAHCFGIKNFIVPRHESVKITPSVVSASSGALFYSTVLETVNIKKTVHLLNSIGYISVATDAEADTTIANFKKNFLNENPNKPLCIIIGSEGDGIRESIFSEALYKVRIPMKGSIDSLSAAQSASVVLYELLIDRDDEV